MLMLRGRTSWASLTTARRRFTANHGPCHVLQLPDASLETFRQTVFKPAVPAVLPRQCFDSMPAVQKWFTRTSPDSPAALNTDYFFRFGATIVPLEIVNQGKFARIEHTISFFLECVRASTSTFVTTPKHPARYFNAYRPNARVLKRQKASNNFFSVSNLAPPTAQVYLAQASLADLPQALRQDVPVPSLVLESGRGDVYDSSVWLGLAPTYTPLHRDPNPNLFVQLAGRKTVRLCEPRTGLAIFAKVQEKIAGEAHATMRGVEMMQGAEKEALEEEVWGQAAHSHGQWLEATLDAGDGIFIPKGWWHSVKGHGPGMTGSVNWWFR